ncbi:MAG: trehalase family glycosidase [Planctomycetota bacterium]|jgi:hypothetical protein|nr:trehalase family glycosidase [Planctomycetota bacterium]
MGSLFTDASIFFHRYDLRLPAWGPYSKTYNGVSHIADAQRGIRFDCGVSPGIYRRRTVPANVRWESGYYPLEASGDLRYHAWRYEVDHGVTMDLAVVAEGDDGCLLRCAFSNQGLLDCGAVLHLTANVAFPPVRTYSNEWTRESRVSLPAGAVWIGAEAHDGIDYAQPGHRNHLPGDGHRQGQVRGHGYVDGTGVSGRDGNHWGRDAGDRIRFRARVAAPGTYAVLLRCRLADAANLEVQLAGDASDTSTIAGTGDFAVARIGTCHAASDDVVMSLSSLGGAPCDLDGMVLVREDAIDQVVFTEHRWQPEPEILAGPDAQSRVLRYADLDQRYGLAWRWPNAEVREFAAEDLDIIVQATCHKHGPKRFEGVGEGHYLDVFLRPIPVPAGAEVVVYALVASGDEAALDQRLANFAAADATELEQTYTASRAQRWCGTGDELSESQQRMAATTLTNVVFPVATRGQWIRHFTPGRNWDCLYTWDSGFIALGLAEIAPERALDCLSAYLCDPDETDCAFIHHGSPLPVQVFAAQELWNRSGDRDMLAWAYPRLARMHRFLCGEAECSNTNTLGSGLLRTWDYFYNSGGWDDYPPQVAVHQQKLSESVTPVINTAVAVRTALQLSAMAELLDQDPQPWRDQAEALAQRIDEHCWDPEAGYYGYLVHNEAKQPTGLLRHESGANHNMGLDGTSPLIGGLLPAERAQRVIAHLGNPAEIWSAIGLSTVDQSAPYYRVDGYWNGAVWMPHQWFCWKALLDFGESELAWRVADTALQLWRDEVGLSGQCFEHFIVATRRGAGWHHFSGLSTPVLSWYAAHYRVQRVTAGHDCWIVSEQWDGANCTAELLLTGRREGEATLLVTSDSAAISARWNGKPVAVGARQGLAWPVAIPRGSARGRLEITA